MIAATIDLGTAGIEYLYQPVPGARHLFTILDYPYQTRRNGFEARENWNPELFVSVSGFGPIPLLVFCISHTYLHYPMAKKRKCAELLRLEEVQIPAFSVLFITRVPAVLWI